MKRNIAKISIVFVFAALFIITVGSAQAAESVWFSGNEQYQPATNILNGGSCYNTTQNSENIYFSTDSGMKQVAKAGTCSLTDGRSYNIWFQASTPN
jgi:hypothetical protein